MNKMLLLLLPIILITELWDDALPIREILYSNIVVKLVNSFLNSMIDDIKDSKMSNY